jgi:ABC-type phosphate transport system auxiliary subunit
VEKRFAVDLAEPVRVTISMIMVFGLILLILVRGFRCLLAACRCFEARYRCPDGTER